MDSFKSVQLKRATSAAVDSRYVHNSWAAVRNKSSNGFTMLPSCQSNMCKICFISPPLIASGDSESRAKGNKWRVSHQSLCRCYLMKAFNSPAPWSKQCSGTCRNALNREEETRDRAGPQMKDGAEEWWGKRARRDEGFLWKGGRISKKAPEDIWSKRICSKNKESKQMVSKIQLKSSHSNSQSCYYHCQTVL